MHISTSISPSTFSFSIPNLQTPPLKPVTATPTPLYHQQISPPPIPQNQTPKTKKMLPSSPTTTTTSTSLSISLLSLFLTILPTLTSALPTPLSPTTSDVDVEMIAPALQFLPQRAGPLTQRMEMEMPMVMIREETSDEEGSDDTVDTEPDCKFFSGNVVGG